MGRKRSVFNGLELVPRPSWPLVEAIWSAISLNPDPLVRERKFGRRSDPWSTRERPTGCSASSASSVIGRFERERDRQNNKLTASSYRRQLEPARECGMRKKQAPLYTRTPRSIDPLYVRAWVRFVCFKGGRSPRAAPITPYIHLMAASMHAQNG